jgi:hypothetical protein
MMSSQEHIVSAWRVISKTLPGQGPDALSCSGAIRKTDFTQKIK